MPSGLTLFISVFVTCTLIAFKYHWQLVYNLTIQCCLDVVQMSEDRCQTARQLRSNLCSYSHTSYDMVTIYRNFYDNTGPVNRYPSHLTSMPRLLNHVWIKLSYNVIWSNHKLPCNHTENMWLLYIVVLMLGQRCRRWTSIKTVFSHRYLW